MPNVKDRIAGQGLRFDNGYTPTALCAPARASFFSGLYSTGHGMYNNYNSKTVMHTGLFPGVTLFSENLKRAGYSLSFIGKWHVSAEKNPADHGWDRPFIGPANQRKAPVPRPKGEELKERRFHGLKRAAIVTQEGWPSFAVYGTRQGVLADMGNFKMGRQAIEEIKRLSKKPDPWIIYVGMTDLHIPYTVVEPYASMYDPNDVPLPENYHDLMEDKPAIYRRMRQERWSQLSERQIREAIAYYWGLCSMNDDIMGMLLDTLDEEDVAKNTLVLYTSDHGDQMGGHGVFLKGVFPFEESYNIPMAIRWPAVIEPGSVSSEFATLCDFAPTFCEMTGSEPMPHSHGRSLVPLFEGATPDDWPQTFFGQYNGTDYYYIQRIIRDRRYKYVFNGFDFDELYDLQEDPHEIKNLAADLNYEDVKRRLIAEMWRWHKKTDDIIDGPYPSVAIVPYGPMIIQ